jgi:hypothetical protein
MISSERLVDVWMLDTCIDWKPKFAKMDVCLWVDVSFTHTFFYTAWNASNYLRYDYATYQLL